MKPIKISTDELKKGLAYIGCAVGAVAGANQEADLIYFRTLSKTKAVLQVQSDVIVAKTEIKINYPDFADGKRVTALIDFGILNKYSKLKSGNDSFELDFTHAESDEALTIKLGTKLVGTMSLVPLDAYELEEFGNTTKLMDIKSSIFSNIVGMASHFVDSKKDSCDYIEFLNEKQTLLAFTTDGDILSTFKHNTKADIEDFNISVRGSVLKKLKSFNESTLKMSKTADDYFLVIHDGKDSVKAVIIHSDPMYSYNEVKEKSTKASHSIGWTGDEVSDALASLECSSQFGGCAFKFKSNDTIVLSSEGLKDTSTVTELGITADKDLKGLLDFKYNTNIQLLRRITALNAKGNNKVALEFTPHKEGEALALRDMHCIGKQTDISFDVSFEVTPADA